MRAVVDPCTGESIQAGEGHCIYHEVVENRDFWVSDIRGGEVLLHFYVVPDLETGGTYRKAKYLRYQLQWEEFYEEEQLVRRCLYSREGEEVLDIRRRLDAETRETVYEKRRKGDSYLYRSTWQNGRLMKREVVSKYGTLLNHIYYERKDDGLGYMEYEDGYNYRQKRLERKKEREISSATYYGFSEEDEFAWENEFWEY